VENGSRHSPPDDAAVVVLLLLEEWATALRGMVRGHIHSEPRK